MTPKNIAILSSLLIILVVGGLMYKQNAVKLEEGDKEFIHIQVKEETESTKKPQITPIEELNSLASVISSEIRAETRLNLNMMSQLRSYEEMLKQVQGYAKKVEKNIDIIKEITKDQFQEDIALQASLFSGKRAEIVAKHLEEFRASRVGAILAKMKEKEASFVLDIWAKQRDPRVSSFYRQVMASYLSNKRYDNQPELFNKLKEPPATQ